MVLILLSDDIKMKLDIYYVQNHISNIILQKIKLNKVNLIIFKSIVLISIHQHCLSYF